MVKINLSSNELAVVKDILKNYKNVFVFGSRIKNKNKQFSDLDVCIKDPISDYDLESLREKFENSDLPFKVDLLTYDKVDAFLKKIIDEEAIILRDVS